MVFVVNFTTVFFDFFAIAFPAFIVAFPTIIVVFVVVASCSCTSSALALGTAPRWTASKTVNTFLYVVAFIVVLI